MTTFQNQSYRDQTISVDGNRYENCTFTECVLSYSGGDLPTFDRCTFTRTNIQLGGAALATTRYLRGLYQGGLTTQVEGVLGRVARETAAEGRQIRFYDPVVTGANLGRLALYSAVMVFATLLIVAFLHYGLTVFPRTQVLNGDTVRPLSEQFPLELMPDLPIALEAEYDAAKQSQLDVLGRYSWISLEEQRVRVPIDVAMSVLLDQGFPTRPEGE